MNDAIVQPEEIGPLVKAKVQELGGVGKAAPHWGCTAQMVHLVIRNERKPTVAMLKDLGLEIIQPELSYRRVQQ